MVHAIFYEHDSQMYTSCVDSFWFLCFCIHSYHVCQRVLLEREAAGHTAAAALSLQLQQRLASWVDMLRSVVVDDDDE